MFKEWKEYLPLSLITFLYILLLTWNIPFFWMDYSNILVLSKFWDYNLLKYGFEFYFRPLENLIYYVFLHLFGIEAMPFRILKALTVVGVVCFVYYFVKKNIDNRKIAYCASLFFLITSTVLQSVMLIYDFEIVAQFFMLCALYFFFKIYDSKPVQGKDIFWFMSLVYIALLLKESTKVFLGVLFLFVIIQGIFYHNWKKILLCIMPFLLFLAVKPGMLIGLQSPSSGSLINFLISWFDYHNFVLFIQYFVIAIFFILILMLGIFFRRRKEKMMAEPKPMLFFGLWFLVCALLTSIVPMADLRYAIVPFLPFVIFAGIYIGKNQQYFCSANKFIIMVFMALFVLNCTLNVGLSVKYRYGYGNFFIVLDESHEFAELNYANSTFIYTDSTAHFFEKTSNIYLEYSYINDSISLPLFFFALQSPLQTKEKETAHLIETFQKGPQCFMLYEQGTETITSGSLLLSSENTLSYIFPNETRIEYCTIELNTRFLLPQEITVTLIGDTENATTAFSPPVGKYKSCEYQCPVFANNETKIKTIKITSSDSFLTKVYDGTVHYIEKI